MVSEISENDLRVLDGIFAYMVHLVKSDIMKVEAVEFGGQVCSP